MNTADTNNMNNSEKSNFMFKNKKLIAGLCILVIVIIVALSALGGKKKVGEHPPIVTDITASATSTVASASSSDPLVQAVRNISYGLKQPQTKLVNGYFVGKFEDCGGGSCNGITYYSHMKLSDQIAVGDLNGDGEDDAAVIIGSATTQSPNIEGVNYTTQVLAAVVKQGNTHKNVAAIKFLGNISALTASIEKISIKNGAIYATVVRNVGSMNLSYPAATEEIQLKLNPAYASGFALFKDGIPENPSEQVQPDITKAVVAANSVNKILTLSGSNFSMFKNTVVLISTEKGNVYESMVVESSKNKSAITIPLSNVGFPALQGNVAAKPYDIKQIPSGTYNVSVETEMCVQGQTCKTTVSNTVEVKI